MFVDNQDSDANAGMYEVTKGVGKVVQELHEMFELVFFFIMMATIYIFMLLGNWGGGGCH